VRSSVSPTAEWALLVGVAALAGVGLAVVTLARLGDQGQTLESWGAPIVAFTVAYCAVVSTLAGALAGLAPLALKLSSHRRAWSRRRIAALSAAGRLLGAIVLAALVLKVHGGEASTDYIGAVALWVVAGWVFDVGTAGRHTLDSERPSSEAH
jgi:hypothetical protein